MKQQVISDFLNLPGVVGIGLMDGHSRPYFSGVDHALNFQQKEALTQGIQQVISTTPKEFESFDFRFAHQDAHIYKLTNGVILLVVTDQELDAKTYGDTVVELKRTLESDPHSAVSTFRLLAGSTTLNRLSDSPSEPSEAIAPQPAAPADTPLTQAASPTDAQTWQDCIAALNTLTDATAKYLGKIVVANTWRSTCPDPIYLECLQVDRSGHFSTSAEIDNSTLIDDSQQALINLWVQKFVQRCSMIIRDYTKMVVQPCLSDPQRTAFQLELED